MSFDPFETFTLNYPPERSSLPVHPRKSCGLSSAVQAAVEGNLVDSVTRVTDDRKHPARHPRLSQRWRSCHVNPTREQMNTSQSIGGNEGIGPLQLGSRDQNAPQNIICYGL